MEKELQAMQKKLNDIFARIEKLENKQPKQKTQRKPSSYNEFMKKTMAQLKSENSELANKDAMSQAAKLWGESSENPKNKA